MSLERWSMIAAKMALSYTVFILLVLHKPAVLAALNQLMQAPHRLEPSLYG